jgi:hypothetical protein
MKALRRIVRDLVNKDVVVTAIKKVPQQVDYVSKLKGDLPDLAKKSGKETSIDTFAGDDFKLPTAPKPKPKPKLTTRKVLIPKDCHLNVKNPKIAEIFKELRSLQLEDYPHAVSVLFRVFLEQSVDDYLTRSGIALTVMTKGGAKDRSLQDKVKEAANDIIAKGTPKKNLDGIFKAINHAENPLHVQTLNNYVHNRFFSPTERELRVAWDNAQPFFEKLWP